MELLFPGFFAAFAATLAILLLYRASTSERDVPTDIPVQSRKPRGAPVLRRARAPTHRILVPVLDSVNAVLAVRHVVGEFLRGERVQVHLLNVRTPLPHHAARWIPARNRAAFHCEAAERALRPARELLDAFHVRHEVHTEVGDKAAVICAMARRLDVDRIVIGVARDNTLTRFVEDSLVEKVAAAAPAPIVVIAGKSASRIERLGVPIGLGAALGLLSIRLND